MPKDKYSSYEELSRVEAIDTDYEIQMKSRSSDIVIVAPHGGGIEPGTSEIAEAVADSRYSYYCFKGKKESNNYDLHIASEKFDEPDGLKIANSAKIVVAIHGCIGSNDKIFVGGLNEDMKNKIEYTLNRTAFYVSTEITDSYAGENPGNICNKGSDCKGIQIEIEQSLRRKMFEGLSSSGRKTKKESFNRFVDAIQQSIEEFNEITKQK